MHPVLDAKALQRIVRTGEKIIGVSHPSIMDIYTRCCIRKAISIVGNPTHPLQTILPYGKKHLGTHCQNVQQFLSTSHPIPQHSGTGLTKHSYAVMHSGAHMYTNKYIPTTSARFAQNFTVYIFINLLNLMSTTIPPPGSDSVRTCKLPEVWRQTKKGGSEDELEVS